MSHGKIRFCGVFGIILILFSIAFFALPLFPNSTLDVMRITVRQRALEEKIVKDVLTLAYRTDEHVQAVSELQNTLPTWEQVQNGLLNGDASLGISPPPSDVNLLLLQAQSDFVSIDTAVHQILAHSSPVDKTQLSIVLQNEQDYYLAMSHVDTLSQEHIQWISQIYFGAGIGISFGLLLIWMLLFRALLRTEERKGRAISTKR